MTDSSDAGSVALDLGLGMGALVVRTEDALAGAELQIQSVEGAMSPYRTHAVARPRRLAASTVMAAVFPSVPCGQYAVWATPSEVVEVDVAGGLVTEATL
jgi:hypothetical protein